jgi:hypothetical protein
VRQLLGAPDGLRSWVGDPAQAASLQEVLQGWLQPAPPVQEVLEERRRLQLARVSLRAGRQLSGDADMASVFSGLAVAVLETLLPWPTKSDGSLPATGNKVHACRLFEPHV